MKNTKIKQKEITFNYPKIYQLKFMKFKRENNVKKNNVRKTQLAQVKREKGGKQKGFPAKDKRFLCKCLILNIMS